MSGNSPTGKWIEDPEAYALSWQGPAYKFAAWMADKGYAAHSYDPDFAFYRDRGNLVSLPSEVVLKVNALVEQQGEQRSAVEDALDVFMTQQARCFGCGFENGQHFVDPADGPCAVGTHLENLASVFGLSVKVEWHDEDGPIGTPKE